MVTKLIYSELQTAMTLYAKRWNTSVFQEILTIT